MKKTLRFGSVVLVPLAMFFNVMFRKQVEELMFVDSAYKIDIAFAERG